MTTPEGRTALYRLYDKDATLLYVGITNNPPARFAQHKADKHWWPLVARKHIEWFAKRSNALAAEEMAIKVKDPVYNTEHGRARIAGRVYLELNLAQMEGLERLTRLIAPADTPAGREFTTEHTLGFLLTRELSARGLFGDVRCFHSGMGWPDGVTLECADGDGCPCGMSILPDGRIGPGVSEAEAAA